MTPAEYKNTSRLVGGRVTIEWRNPNDDWPSFVLLDINTADDTLHLRGADMSFGAKHAGDTFFADWSDVRSIKADAE